MWLTFYLFSVAYGERSRLLSLLRPSFSCRPRRAEKGPGWCAQGERARGREDAGTERGAYTSRYNADTLPLPRRSCIRCRGESRAKQRRTGLSTPSLPYGVQDARPRVCIVYEREKDWSGERLRTWVVWFEGCIVSQVLKTVAVSPRRYYFSHLRAILDSFVTDRSESILFYPFDLISDLFINGAWNEKRRSTCCGSFSLGWSRSQQGRHRHDSSWRVSLMESIDPGWIFSAGTIENSIYRDQVDRSLQGNHWEEIAGPLSSLFLTSFVPLLTRKQETVLLRRTKARSRFQFGRALVPRHEL